MDAATALAPGATGTALADWKQRLAAERERLRTAFQLHPAAGALLRRTRAVVDRQLRDVWKRFDMPPGLALLAVGGYGRGQLFPYSDVDLVILLAEPADPPLERRLEQLIGSLWDIGLEVGHSVRTVEECVTMAEQD